MYTISGTMSELKLAARKVMAQGAMEKDRE